MKTALFILLVTLSISGFSQKKQLLFNGKNLDGWKVYVSDSTIKPATFCGVGLQAEGSKIQFRNIWIEKLK